MAGLCMVKGLSVIPASRKEIEMAKDKAKKHDPGHRSGGKKSSRWSVQTQANKARKATRRLERFVRAAERRDSLDWINPATGKKARGGTLTVKRQARTVQAVRVDQKAKQRRNFKKLDFSQKIAHRDAGLPSRTVHPS